MRKDTPPDVELEVFETFKQGYRVRLLQPGRPGPRALDIREYLDGSSKTGFVGFTRKGLRVNREQAIGLRAVIDAALKAGL